jgi:NodT family efflux transporter outer membrane factor (OMF) lipoprotein
MRARAALLAPLLLLLAQCKLGPDFRRPAAPDVTGYTAGPLPAETSAARTRGGEAQRFVRDMDIPGQWWTLFHSATLNRLVVQALAANPDLQAAQAALRQARENVYAGQGALFPTLTGNASAEREKFPGAAFGLPGISPTFSLITATLNISYAPDVFGGTRRQIESLAAQTEYQRFQLEAAYLTLTSNLVVAAIEEASLRGQIAATEEIIKAETDQLNVVRQQFELGAAARSDVLQQEATLAQTRSTLPPLEKQLAQTRHQIRALAGRFPSQDSSEVFELARLKLPRDLPVTLPSLLVRQRPDVRAAEAQLHAASANIGVAVANQLPQFSITGQLGTETTRLGQLVSPGTGVWSIGGSVAQTLFDAATLQHKKRAAVFAFEEAAAQYRSTVLKAFQNVADALRALQADADALAAAATAERSAFDSFDLARRQYRLGAITYLTLLTAERTWQQARVTLVQAEANRYSDTAALFQALGGGWWNRTDVAPHPFGPDRFVIPIFSAFQK